MMTHCFARSRRINRNVVFPVALIVAVCLTPASVARASESDGIARGVVFEDRNLNHIRDEGEPGIADVPVSNQDTIVRTDAKGRYELPVDDDTIIFVIKPDGYDAPVNDLMLPRFYYIHKPGGSPTLHYPGVSPTGPLPDSVDFPLTRSKASQRFTVIALADPQPENSHEVHHVRDDVFTELVGADAEFAVTLGDIMSDQLDLFDMYNRAAARVGFPFYNVIGNHDMNYDAADDSDSDETFHRWFGPNYYAFNRGNVHFVAMDDVHWKGAGQGGGNYECRFGQRQLAWLAKDLQGVPDDHLVVIMTHIPLITPLGYPCGDLSRFFETIASRRKVLALSGHTHYQEEMVLGPEAGWQGPGQLHQLNIATVSGAWWSGHTDKRGIPTADCRDGTPNGYVVVTFDGADYVTDFKGANLDPAHQMRIYPPGSTPDDKDNVRIIANVFAGGPKSTVEYSIDHGPFTPMRLEPQRDPSAMQLLDLDDPSAKPWASANVSHHIWMAELPEPLPRGMHVITVRHRDFYDRVHVQSVIVGR